MLIPLTEKQRRTICKNVVDAAKDIKKLNKNGYDFLYLASGFIAHYNIHGFKEHYEEHSLRKDILLFERQNEWKNFSPGDQNYAYYMAKADVYKRICESIRMLEVMGEYL